MAPEKKAKELKRKNVVCLKLTDLELTFLDQSAEEARLTRSEYLRGLILNRKITVKYQIVINSDEVKDLLAGDNKAGMKHRSTKRFLDHFKVVPLMRSLIKLASTAKVLCFV